jgi:hypothetical protein
LRLSKEKKHEGRNQEFRKPTNRRQATKLLFLLAEANFAIFVGIGQRFELAEDLVERLRVVECGSMSQIEEQMTKR